MVAIQSRFTVSRRCTRNFKSTWKRWRMSGSPLLTGSHPSLVYANDFDGCLLSFVLPRASSLSDPWQFSRDRCMLAENSKDPYGVEAWRGLERSHGGHLCNRWSVKWFVLQNLSRCHIWHIGLSPLFFWLLWSWRVKLISQCFHLHSQCPRWIVLLSRSQSFTDTFYDN